MNANKHTPGEWEERETMSGAFEIIQKGESNPMHGIAWTAEPCLRTSRDEIEANARLIAAAPELLRVVESVVLWDMSKSIGRKKPAPLYDHIITDARAALEKAGAL